MEEILKIHLHIQGQGLFHYPYSSWLCVKREDNGILRKLSFY